MVRLSDMVRGIHRETTAPPPREGPAARRGAIAPLPPRPDDEDNGRVSSPVRFPVEALRRRPAPTRIEPGPSKPPVPTPVFSEVARSIERAPEPSPPRQEGPTAEVLYGEILAFIVQLSKLVRQGGEFEWGEFRIVVEQTIRSLESSSDLFWLANSPPRQDTDYLAAHLVNVGVLSLRIGMAQGYSGERLVELGMAAFLFDVGMWRLPEAMLGKTEQLSDEEVAAIRSHPRLSAEIVRRWQPPLPSVVEIIQQHHEREQGQGYPQGLAGDAINSGAKIIGLMDTYAALIHPRPYRPRFHPHEAVREILRSKREGFPSHLVKTLLAEISVFPPRTVVKLNNGEVGRVIAVNRNHPLRPKVEILADARGSRLAVPKILDLSEAPFLYITGPLSEAAR